MNPFSLIPAPYQLLAKGLALLALVIALYVAWHAFTGHYIQIGISQQLAADQKVADAARERVRAKESLDAVKNQTIMNNLYEEKENERKQLEATIANLKSGNIRMRVITGNAVNNLPDTPADTKGANATCSVRLPEEIGDTYYRAKEQVDNLVSNYQALQAIVEQDRKTCN